MKRFLLLILLSLSLPLYARKPVIGISSSCTEQRSMIKETYVRAVYKAGGIPLILPQVESRQEARELVAVCDGLIFSGGEDVNPSYYGETVIEEAGVEIIERRDISDFLLASEAIESGKAILGICRGEQLLNVALGGSLWQDILIQADTLKRQDHRNSDRNGKHRIVLVPGSRLHSLFGSVPTIEVNSFHHQAVKDLAPGLSVCAVAEDGIVEAYDGFPRYNLLCVQFHPEVYAKKGDKTFLSVFKDLVRRAKK